MPNSKVILLISGGGNRKCEWDNIHNKYFVNCAETACAHMLLYYSNISKTATVEMNDQCSLIFINETVISSTISKMMESHKYNQYAIAVHGSSHRYTEISKMVNLLKLEYDDLVIYEPVEFNHASGRMYSTIAALMKSILDNIGDFSANFDALWKALVPSPAEEANRLRDELLLPLVGLDWLAKMKKDNATKNRIEAAIKKNNDDGKLAKLYKYLDVQDGEMLPDYLKYIKNMMVILEVNHTKFKNAAQELEAAIVELEKKETVA